MVEIDNMTLSELKSEKRKIESSNEELLKKGKNTESEAGIVSIFTGWFVGGVLLIIKFFKHGFVEWIHTDMGGLIDFVIENALIIVVVQIVLYILIKPYYIVKNNKAKQQMTSLEYSDYLNIKKDLDKLKSKINELSPKEHKSNSNNDEPYKGYCNGGSTGCM